MKFEIEIQREDDGRFSVSCPVLPGCHSQGDTEAEALANIKEAIELYLEDLEAAGDPFPTPVRRETIEVHFGKAG